ncbi:hypothetical protein E0Z10_g7049 [Xylaria hypoxylon]|uniref:ZZ-type domain-containing protein n=1 Tax=Xylaria hypoxylon TaxID=37992 RepID=A0A4Z0YZ90_9PEZI|nr:hypothetical protein E0Z10_g7049 [Xylaria hypoxylon]
MASSSSTAVASTLTRHRIAIALTSAAAIVSLGYYYYHHHYSAEQLDLDVRSPNPSSGPRLQRRNALRRPRRPDQQQDDSSGSESHGDDHVDASAFPFDGSPNETAADTGAADPSATSTSDPIPMPTIPDPGRWYIQEPSPPTPQRTGENIVTLLFRVSEDNARRNAYVHRGCLCNGCGMLPIRGIRYRCANCPDFDLCEMCESQGSHNKAHVFYKVKIPVPSSAARHVQPPWYPGDPNNVPQNLPRDLLAKWSHETGFERVELDALWEQWTFMANTEWREDPNHLCLAMDRKTFERCLVPSAGYRHPTPNLIHERMFAFYDTNHDDLIGFEEYLHGVSYKRRKDKLKRTFDGYDVDDDGYVNRRDFLRMFRAYYVSYKQMHRDTVEGLDDYMMTNVEVQQLVNGRQPISSLFGRDQRIPDAEGGRPMEGKVIRSGGEVDVPDGKGAVSEDKPDAASREDILRELFTRNSNQSLFTESFGSSSRRPQSPARDTHYWSGILNPPRNTVDLASLLSGGNAQIDEILDSIRQQDPRVFLADDGEGGSSDDEDYESSPDDRMDDEGEMNHPSIDDDGNRVASPGLPDAREFVNALPSEIQLQPQHETFANHFDKRKRVIARKQLYERWKRRQFYLDEEEGGMAPQGWRDEQDILTNVNDIAEPSKSAPPLLSPRSRSSSKVRFAEDTDDFETRSNPSTSSRSVPERWGGMEIPDAERDAGKEILYQITQQAFNELLDALFKKKEDLAVLAAESKEQREKYRELLDTFEPQDEDEKSTKESPESPALRPVFDGRPIQQQNLQELLSASGYTLASVRIEGDERPHQATNHQSENVERALENDQIESMPSAATSSPNYSASGSPEYRDPTMPQFMPNSVPQTVHAISTQIPGSNDQYESSASVSKTSRVSTGDQGRPPVLEVHLESVDTTDHISRSTLAMWRELDQAEQEARERSGWGRLSYAEFEEIYREHEFQEGMKNRLAYLGSWIDFCIPS